MGHNTYFMRVTKFDMTAEEALTLTDREKNYLFGEFVESANTEEEAIAKLSNRLGWGIVSVSFNEASNA